MKSSDDIAQDLRRAALEASNEILRLNYQMVLDSRSLFSLLTDVRNELSECMMALAKDGGVTLTDTDVAEDPLIKRLDRVLGRGKNMDSV